MRGINEISHVLTKELYEKWGDTRAFDIVLKDHYRRGVVMPPIDELSEEFYKEVEQMDAELKKQPVLTCEQAEKEYKQTTEQLRSVKGDSWAAIDKRMELQEKLDNLKRDFPYMELEKPKAKQQMPEVKKQEPNKKSLEEATKEFEQLNEKITRHEKYLENEIKFSGADDPTLRDKKVYLNNLKKKRDNLQREYGLEPKKAPEITQQVTEAKQPEAEISKPVAKPVEAPARMTQQEATKEFEQLNEKITRTERNLEREIEFSGADDPTLRDKKIYLNNLKKKRDNLQKEYGLEAKEAPEIQQRTPEVIQPAIEKTQPQPEAAKAQPMQASQNRDISLHIDFAAPDGIHRVKFENVEQRLRYNEFAQGHPFNNALEIAKDFFSSEKLIKESQGFINDNRDLIVQRLNEFREDLADINGPMPKVGADLAGVSQRELAFVLRTSSAARATYAAKASFDSGAAFKGVAPNKVTQMDKAINPQKFEQIFKDAQKAMPKFGGGPR
ncbi:MAG: hypothetical protein LBM38_00185 [Clostridiales bacterium]|nr:hypothetical protein [Clostridiales bacterium]